MPPKSKLRPLQPTEATNEQRWCMLGHMLVTYYEYMALLYVIG